MRLIALACAALALSATTAAAEFTISFSWGATPACNTGRAKTIGSPAFVVKGLPAGADRVEFRMKDLDAPNYNHGGGTVGLSRDATVPAGTFKYKGPCPPGQTHTYVWTATAKKGSQKLGTATAQRRFPE
ncbi:MAG: YbhB/YbcL family Raf kinase inhibitor-like protein [Roseovarius sp.]